jgi:chemotaxis protein CheD
MTTLPQSDRSLSVIQGEFRISEASEDLLSTVLGSCVAVCLHDPGRRIGGMNHFLLPFGQGHGTDRPVRYGLFAMEILVNELMKQGAVKARLQAKIFGGAKIMADLGDIGKANARFAQEFLHTEGIPCLAESLGGTNARRIVFRPSTGVARMMLVPSSNLSQIHPLLSPAKQEPDHRIDLF